MYNSALYWKVFILQSLCRSRWYQAAISDRQISTLSLVTYGSHPCPGLSPWPIQSVPLTHLIYFEYFVYSLMIAWTTISDRQISTLSLLTKAYGSHLCPNCPHDQFNPCPLSVNFLMCQGLVKILTLKEYISKIPKYHYCRILIYLTVWNKMTQGLFIWFKVCIPFFYIIKSNVTDRGLI